MDHQHRREHRAVEGRTPRRGGVRGAESPRVPAHPTRARHRHDRVEVRRKLGAGTGQAGRVGRIADHGVHLEFLGHQFQLGAIHTADNHLVAGSTEGFRDRAPQFVIGSGDQYIHRRAPHSSRECYSTVGLRIGPRAGSGPRVGRHEADPGAGGIAAPLGLPPRRPRRDLRRPATGRHHRRGGLVAVHPAGHEPGIQGSTAAEPSDRHPEHAALPGARRPAGTGTGASPQPARAGGSAADPAAAGVTSGGGRPRAPLRVRQARAAGPVS